MTILFGQDWMDGWMVVWITKREYLVIGSSSAEFVRAGNSTVHRQLY